MIFITARPEVYSSQVYGKKQNFLTSFSRNTAICEKKLKKSQKAPPQTSLDCFIKVIMIIIMIIIDLKSDHKYIYEDLFLHNK